MNKFYKTLRNEPYKAFVETKGNGNFKADYLSWAVVHDIVKKSFQYVEYKVHEYQNIDENGRQWTSRYMLDPDTKTAMVAVTVTATDKEGDEHKHEECLAVRNFQMQAARKPDMVQVENTIRRCIAKAGSMLTGLGIELWFNEDLKGLDYDPNNPDSSKIPNYKNLAENTSGTVKTVPDEVVKLRALAQSVEFKNSKESVIGVIDKWLGESERSKDEVLAKYIKLKDVQEGIRKENKKEKETA